MPVDASEAWRNPDRTDYFFGGLDENRVQFSVGRDIDLRPLQQGRSLNYFIYPYVEVDGKFIADAVDYWFSFKDVVDTAD